MRLIGISRKERYIRCEAAILGDDPRFVVELLFQNIAQEASSILFVILAAAPKLFFYDRRHERIRVDLPVRVMQRHADGLALVLKNENVLDKIVRLKLGKTVAPNLDELVNTLDGLCRERR